MFGLPNNGVRSRKPTHPQWNQRVDTKVSSVSTFSIQTPSQNLLLPTVVPESRSKKVWKIVTKNVKEYFENSTLHGLRYIGDNKISFGERIFWLLAFITAVSSAAFFINRIYAKYDLTPIIITLNPRPTFINQLPFPAITICSMNQAKKNEAQSILESGTELEKMLLDDYCSSNTSFSNLSLINDEVSKWENVQKFILRVNPSCQEVFKVCMWRQQEMPCEELVNSALTDDGLCCTFNALPPNSIFKNAKEMAGLNLSFSEDVDDWNPENGYSPNASIRTLPLRASGAGAHLGFSVVLDSQLNTYYCSSTTGVGFKVLLHNPLESPKMADFATFVAPGLEARIVIQPKIYDASQTIRGIDIARRMCYFTKERDLQFYRTYTELNCKLECLANYTLRLCGCVPIYLPKDKSKKICSKRQQYCVNIAKEIMEFPSQKT
ncbi:hypothetical protein FQA39_LY08116 [Lamprigera yunnana]|nr:hypothetical protein FQA39_LY08116 [Lamprigera yunnana]